MRCMLNFDESRYVDIQSGAVGLATEIREALKKELDNGAKNIFFAGAGEGEVDYVGGGGVEDVCVGDVVCCCVVGDSIG